MATSRMLVIFADGRFKDAPWTLLRSVCTEECGGTGICEHQMLRVRSRCKDCPGNLRSAIITDRLRETLQGMWRRFHLRASPSAEDCGETSGLRSSPTDSGRQCKDCGGASVCEHHRVRSRCKDCGETSVLRS